VASTQGEASGGTFTLSAVSESAVPLTSLITQVSANESVTITQMADSLNESN